MGICGGTLSEHGTSVPIGSTVISGLKSRAPMATNINLSVTTNADNTSNFNCRINK